MDDIKPRKTRVKVIHYHHYHHHRTQPEEETQNQITHQRQTVQTTSHHSRRHHRHDRRESNRRSEYDNYDDESPNNYNDDFPNNDYLNDPPRNSNRIPENIPSRNNPNYERPKKKPKNRNSPKKIVTYYIPETPVQDPIDLFPSNVKNLNESPDRNAPNDQKYPYPLETLQFLKHHPLPEDDLIHDSNGDWPKEPKRIRFISDFKKYQQPKGEGYSYWTDIEIPLTRERMGGYVEIPPKQLPMMYPFTQMSPRKLPWDFSDVELVPTRPNKPKKPFQPKSFSYCEEYILGSMRVPTLNDKTAAVLRKSEEFKFIETWILVCFGKPYKKLVNLTRFGNSSRFLEFERTFKNIHLVLFPCSSPIKYTNSQLPQKMVVHRCVSKAVDLIRLLKKTKKMASSFLVCAADLGNEAIDYHPKCIPTQSRENSLRENGFDSLFYRNERVECILILDSARVVPLYACQLSYC